MEKISINFTEQELEIADLRLKAYAAFEARWWAKQLVSDDFVSGATSDDKEDFHRTYSPRHPSTFKQTPILAEQILKFIDVFEAQALEEYSKHHYQDIFGALGIDTPDPRVPQNKPPMEASCGAFVEYEPSSMLRRAMKEADISGLFIGCMKKAHPHMKGGIMYVFNGNSCHTRKIGSIL